jgi:hypothetical protein
MRTPLFLGVGIWLAASALGQEKPELKARELFYTPVTEVKTTPTAKETSAKAGAAKPAKPKNEPRQNAATLPDGTRLQTTTSLGDDVVGPPLALKYRLLKRSPEGRYDEVDTDTVFRSGDKIRVSVESNDSGYLYIVQQGSSKTWNLLFPNEDTENGSNHVQRNREYDLPGGGRFTFDEQPGNERMFIVLSRRPEPDLEKLIYTLSQSGGAKPASVQRADGKTQVMMAQSRIDDAIIDRLRGKVLARDLVFEKVNDDAPVSTSAGTRKEKALYVATPDRTANARVVVDLNLKHQ